MDSAQQAESQNADKQVYSQESLYTTGCTSTRTKDLITEIPRSELIKPSTSSLQNGKKRKQSRFVPLIQKKKVKGASDV